MRPDTKVYFLATADRSMVKIGCSYFPPNRLAAVQAWCPGKLEMLVSVPGNLNDERALHGRHMANHAHHEWFYASEALLADIAEIQSLGYLPEKLKGGPDEPTHIKADHSYRRGAEWRARNSDAQKKRWADARSAAREPTTQ